MFSVIYSQIMKMTLVAGYVILLVLLFRLLIKKAPKCFSHLLWMAVLFRLLCPVSIQTPVSLIPQSIEKVEIDALLGEEKELSERNSIYTLQEYEYKFHMWDYAGKHIWLLGMLGVACYYGRQYMKLRRKLFGATRLNDSIYVADHISVPVFLRRQYERKDIEYGKVEKI